MQVEAAAPGQGHRLGRGDGVHGQEQVGDVLHPGTGAERAWSPAPGPISTLHPILEQIEEHAASMGLSASVFTAAKEVFDKALADGWGDLDIASVHDQVNR